ncbi:hypothetical protein BC829DRAFT_446124 [Chytridium lagenaria]|nr:hypothetical protein BC829DRAFT_446124 [Chytridium lagenaria]
MPPKLPETAVLPKRTSEKETTRGSPQDGRAHAAPAKTTIRETSQESLPRNLDDGNCERTLMAFNAVDKTEEIQSFKVKQEGNHSAFRYGRYFQKIRQLLDGILRHVNRRNRGSIVVEMVDEVLQESAEYIMETGIIFKDDWDVPWEILEINIFTTFRVSESQKMWLTRTIARLERGHKAGLWSVRERSDAGLGLVENSYVLSFQRDGVLGKPTVVLAKLKDNPAPRSGTPSSSVISGSNTATDIMHCAMGPVLDLMLEVRVVRHHANREEVNGFCRQRRNGSHGCCGRHSDPVPLKHCGMASFPGKVEENLNSSLNVFGKLRGVQNDAWDFVTSFRFTITAYDLATQGGQLQQ